MSEDTADLTVTLKAGTGFDAPWIVVRGDNPGDVAAKLKGLDAVIEATHEAAGLFAAGRLAAPQGQSQAQVPPTSQPAAQPAQQGWGQQQGQQQSAAPAPRQSKFGGPPHPEGKTCAICPNVLEKKKTGSGKEVWRCNDWRWNNGEPNGHSSEFID